MTDDISLFDARMRWPAAISVAVGVVLGLLTGYTINAGTPEGPSWLVVVPFAVIATVFLYIASYRNRSKRAADR